MTKLFAECRFRLSVIYVLQVALATLISGCDESDEVEDITYIVHSNNTKLLVDIKYLNSNQDTIVVTNVVQGKQWPSWQKRIDAELGDSLFISVKFSNTNHDSLWTVWPLSLSAGIDENNDDGRTNIHMRENDWPDTITVTSQFVVR